MDKTTGIPAGFHTVTPYLIVRDAAKAIDLYQRALGAVEHFRWAGADGTIRHAEIQIGDSMLMLTNEGEGFPGPQTLGGSPVHLFLYVPDVDSFMQRAAAAGMEIIDPPENKPDGDRRGGLKDAFGLTWWVATQIENISREELQRRYNRQQVAE